MLEAARLDEIVEQVVRSLEFSVLAKYAFGLAQPFNAFYHRAPILNEERADVRAWRAAGVAYFRAQLTRALDLMGIAGARKDVDMPIIGVIAVRTDVPTTRRRCARRRRRCACSTRCTTIRPRWCAASSGLLLTGGGDVAPALLRRGAP